MLTVRGLGRNRGRGGVENPLIVAQLVDGWDRMEDSDEKL
jgi:hypothetical protein